MAIDDLGQLPHGPAAVFGSDLLRLLLHPLARFRAGLVEEVGQILDPRLCVPDVDRTHLGETIHRSAVSGKGLNRRRRHVSVVELAMSGGDHEAGSQGLHVPFPRSGKGLVEVVEVEDELSFRRSEDSEVAQVGVAA